MRSVNIRKLLIPLILFCSIARAASHKHRHLVLAGWYGPKFNGKQTASGEIFNENALTVASLTYKLGTRLRLCNPKNYLCVEVRVNDRGPFVRGRGLDVSMRVAEILRFKKAGLARLSVEVE